MIFRNKAVGQSVKMTGAFLAVTVLCVIIGCDNRKESYTSPNGQNTIVVRYDSLSRPQVKYGGKNIWKYEEGGFAEEVFFEVEWIDNDSFKLIYNDESHNGKYSEEYIIDLK